jgi:redox-sensing transcriptional repressor
MVRLPIAEGLVARLLRCAVVLTEAQRTGRVRITSRELAAYTGVNATQIRRDLSSLGRFGTRGRGYSVEALLGEIRELLFRKGEQRLALVGAGRLGQAIANSPIFAEYGVGIAAIFDIDAGKVGTRVGGLLVEDTSRLG